MTIIEHHHHHHTTMNYVNVSVMVAIIVVIVIVAMTILGYFLYKKRESYCAPCRGTKSAQEIQNYYSLDRKDTLGPCKTGCKKSGDVSFSSNENNSTKFYNYLEYPLKIMYVPKDGKRRKVLYNYIKPESSGILSQNNIDIKEGDKLQFFIIKDGKDISFLDDVVVTSSTPFSLHIGQVTSAMLHYMSPVIFGGGSHEITQLWIHNLGNTPLTFNGHIFVPPKSVIRYDGTGSFAPSGVSIGMTLHNDEGYYADFLIDRKLSDIYYGVVSKDAKPVYQGSQYPPYLVPTA